MLYRPGSNFVQRSNTSGLGDYEKLFRSPCCSSSNSKTPLGNKSVLRPPIEPTPLSLGGGSEIPSNSHCDPHLITPKSYQLSASTLALAPGPLKSDTHDAALLLTSLKKLAVREEETIDLPQMSLPLIPSLKLRGASGKKSSGTTTTTATAVVTASTPTFSQLCAAYEKSFEQRNIGSEGGITIGNGTTKTTATATNATSSSTRARAVSVDMQSQLFAPIYLEKDCAASSFRTDALPKEKICLDLTLDHKGSESSTGARTNLGMGLGMTMGVPATISPPTSPVLESYKYIASKQNQMMKGPQGLLSGRNNGDSNKINKKKRQISQLKRATGPERMIKKKKPRARPSILRASTKEIERDADENGKGSSDAIRNNSNTNNVNNSISKNKNNSTSNIKSHSDLNNKKILRKKFSWKSYPELESFLIANREEYLRHSAMNYTMQQKEYNNRLTERLLELASECGYVFDEESFSFVSIRDRIRCYFKSYVQSKKKRGLILGYAARRKGLITEEELEKSAGIKGTIVVPKKTIQKKAKASSSLPSL